MLCSGHSVGTALLLFWSSLMELVRDLSDRLDFCMHAWNFQGVVPIVQLQAAVSA